MHIRGQNGAIVNDVACVQYVYKKEVQFAMKPHKGSKSGNSVLYTRTKSILRQLQESIDFIWNGKDAKRIH